jgi:NAD(P)-dependent dehydrogenase (short-subunit alcohol dehydrogenase family)
MGWSERYGFSGSVVVITGGAGVLCSTMAIALGDCGAKVVILDIAEELTNRLAKEW